MLKELDLQSHLLYALMFTHEFYTDYVINERYANDEESASSLRNKSQGIIMGNLILPTHAGGGAPKEQSTQSSQLARK